MKTWFLLLCLVAVSFLAACSEDPPTSVQTGENSVAGVVRDEQGFPVPHAVLEALNAASSLVSIDTSDETGAFALSGLPADLGSMKVRITHSDFKPLLTELSTIVSNAGGNTGVLLSMEHIDSCCGRLALTTSAIDGTRIGGVEVKLRKGDRLVTMTTTDSTGALVFENLCEGRYNLRFAKSGYGVVERVFEIGYCDTTSLDIRLEANNSGGGDTCCGGLLRIVPRDSATNTVITGASIRITRPNGATVTKESSSEGSGFGELCQGEYEVRIAREGYRVVEFSVTMGCDEEKTVTRTLARNGDTCCDGRVIVIVRDSATNAVLTGATVKLWKGNQMVRSGSMTANGLAFEDLCNGNYGVSISKEGYRAIEFDFEAPKQAQAQRLSARRRQRGRALQLDHAAAQREREATQRQAGPEARKRDVT
jgi:hypothetical protein